MPRSRSSYTASPTRYPSPQRSPARRPSSEEGSQYEIDMDALGMDSTFGSTGLEDSHAPKVDVVDTSDIEGPEDFTMNMTYWMTADLSPAKSKWRKETDVKVEEIHEDTRQHAEVTQDSTEEGDRAVIEDTARDRVVSDEFNSASPTVRVNGTLDGHEGDHAHSESSMENDEKVMSYLSALPDTDLPGAITSTPLKLTKNSTLQVPAPAVSKARSLQATVEDYDTPRKPTQDTVIHYDIREPSTVLDSTDHDALRSMIVELQSRLEQQESASKTRITELETILSFTRSELESARTQSYMQKEEIAGLKDEGERRKQVQSIDTGDVGAQIREKENELTKRMHEFGEELRLQNQARMQSQREDFERQLSASEQAKQVAEAQVEQKDDAIAKLRSEMDRIQRSKEHELQTVKTAHNIEQQRHEEDFAKQRTELNERLASLQTRAEGLQADLEKATADAQSARMETDTTRNYVNCISGSESRIQSLQSQLDASRADASMKDQQLLHNIEEQERIEQRLNTAQGRVESLESTVSALRQQLADVHRESSKARADVERYEKDLEVSHDRLDDVRKEADRRVADIDKKLSKMKESKIETESKFKELQSERENLVEDHEARLDDVREKAEDAVRKAGALLERERSEKRRIAKELKAMGKELDKIRSEAAKKAAEEDESDEGTSMLSMHSDSKDVEIENLHTLLKKQASDLKTLKSANASLRKKKQSYDELHAELDPLRQENDNLRAQFEKQRADFEAVNKAMDERIAAMLTRALKERSKDLVGKRDDQWVESVGKLKSEREFMGKVLMREWGKQECGVAEEKENQVYWYQYVKRA